MFGLTPLGLLHTAVSLIAVALGVISLIRCGEISSRNVLGKSYMLTTIVTCVTALGIFQHGGFGKAHALALLTIFVLGVSFCAERYRPFGKASRYVCVIGYSATMLFHLIPAATEAATRLPLGNPLLTSADDPALKTASGMLALLFLIGAAWQARRIRAAG